jgi:hypothetical protein
MGGGFLFGLVTQERAKADIEADDRLNTATLAMMSVRRAD